MKNLDFKTILIIVLIAACALMWIFRPSKPIDKYEEEIKRLNDRNIELVDENNGLKDENAQLDSANVLLNEKIDEQNKLLEDNQGKINNLLDRLEDVDGVVKEMDGGEVIEFYQDYFDKKLKEASDD